MQLLRTREAGAGALALKFYGGMEPEIKSDDMALLSQVIRQERIDRLMEVLGSLKPDEKKVITLRYGLEDGTRETFKAIGDAMGLSGSRIQQMHAVAMRKLRHPVRAGKVSNLFAFMHGGSDYAYIKFHGKAAAYKPDRCYVDDALQLRSGDWLVLSQRPNKPAAGEDRRRRNLQEGLRGGIGMSWTPRQNDS